MVQPVDYGAIIRSGQAIVPDYAQQQALQQQMALQESQNRLAQQTQLFKQQETQREVDEDTAYQNDLATYLKTNNPQDLVRLSAKYPKKSEAIKRAFDAQDQVVKDADLRQAASILGYVSNGRADLAAKSLEDRIAKARAAGEPDDPQDMAILEALKSEDPDRIKEAQGLITYQVAAITGVDKFGQTFKDISGDEKLSPFMREYNDRVKQFGQANADAWAQTQDAKERALIVPGKGIYDASTVFGGGGDVTEGGGPTSSDGAAPPTSAAPSDIYSITETIESGGNPNAVSPKGARGPMQTMPGTLRDPGFGVTPARDNSVPEMRRVGREYIDAMRGKYNGDMRKAWAAYNWGPGNLDEAIAKHGENGWFAKAPKETRNYVRKAMSMLTKADKASAPVKVTSVQQASALPPGTLYMRPDGKVMKR